MKKPENLHLGILWRGRKAVYGENSGMYIGSYPQEDLLEDVGELYDYMGLIENFMAKAIKNIKIKDEITLLYDVTNSPGFGVSYTNGKYIFMVPMLYHYKKKYGINRFDRHDNVMVCRLYTNLAHELCHIVKEDSRYFKVGFFGFNNEVKALTALKETRADLYALGYMLKYYKNLGAPDFSWMDEKDPDGVKIDYKTGGYFNREKRIEHLEKYLTYRPNTVKDLLNLFEFDRFTSRGKLVRYIREKYKKDKELMYFSGLLFYKIEKL